MRADDTILPELAFRVIHQNWFVLPLGAGLTPATILIGYGLTSGAEPNSPTISLVCSDD